jgi:hypothetical protein
MAHRRPEWRRQCNYQSKIYVKNINEFKGRIKSHVEYGIMKGARKRICTAKKRRFAPIDRTQKGISK